MELLNEVLQTILTGISIGCVYSLVALGFVLIFKATEVINFAQGELLMLGAFISYSHKDEKWKDQLAAHLGVLAKQDLLDPWDDRKIAGGADWFPEIERAINAAQRPSPRPISADVTRPRR